MSHFMLISSTKAFDAIPLNKYVSKKTGITVVIAEVEGPIVNGFFSLATEAHDDDGLPHTLEHLIFLGSQRYPYKGILDLLANRCMAHGTSAWTCRDFTCYTVYTAGHEGMLTLLPIYLDHILFPTLTEEGFITEVHHIDCEGEDAGVVYCEMQGLENTSNSRCLLTLIRAMYPDSGYSAEVGGIMKNLRESTDIDKVKNFHKKFYRPENLTIILTGQIQAEDVFTALSVVEDDIIAKRQSDPSEQWVKPWQVIPPAPVLAELKEQWPADTEDCGQVLFGWRGPLLTEPTALKELTVCSILLRYLCDSAVAPLQRCLVEREDALAANVSYYLTENLASSIKIELDNVPVDKLEAAEEEAKNCLRNLRERGEAIDLYRIHRLLKKQLREIKVSLESEPHRMIAFRVIFDALYSQNEQDFFSRMNPQVDIVALLSESTDYWVQMLLKYFTDDLITVVGQPSIRLQAQMAEAEKKRIEEQKKQLGTSGLEKKRRLLKEALEFNERPPLPGTLASVPIPSCENLKYYNTSLWSTDGTPCPHMDLNSLPLYTRLHSIKTNLVYINIILDTSSVGQATRKWMPIFKNSLGQCSVRRDDTFTPHEEVISTAEEITASLSFEVGLDKPGNFSVGTFGNYFHIEARCEPEYYEQVVNYLYEILHAAEITKERMLVFAQRMINDVAQTRRNGNKLLNDSLRDLIYIKDSNQHWCSVLRQQKFLKELIETLGAGGDTAQVVIEEAKSAFANITSNLWLHLVTDFDRNKLSSDPWKIFEKGKQTAPQIPKLFWDADMQSPLNGGGFVIGVGGLDSSFVAQLSRGPLGYVPADYASLIVALNYFTQLEGPMWRQIRGCGLSYSYGLRMSPTEGVMCFSLYRATNAIAAYSKAKSILEEYLANPTFDEDLFASAKCTSLFEVVRGEKCTTDVVKQSLLYHLQRVEPHYLRILVNAISAVTQEQAHAALARWLPGVLEPASSSLGIVCHPTKVYELQASFDKMGVKLEAFESIEDLHFNK